MLFQSLSFQRGKGAEPNVQGDSVGFNAQRSIIQQRFGEMKPGGGAATELAIGIYSLIPLSVVPGLTKGFASNVRR